MKNLFGLIILWLSVACSNLTVLIPNNQALDGDVQYLGLDDNGKLLLKWKADGKQPGYDIYLQKVASLPEQKGQTLKLNKIDKFTSVSPLPKKWQMDLRTSGEKIASVSAKGEYTFDTMLDSNVYYVVQVIPHRIAPAFQTRGAVLKLNLAPPRAPVLTIEENGYRIAWTGLEGISEYLIFDSSNPDKVLMRTRESSIFIPYSTISSGRQLCIRTLLGPVLSGECETLQDEYPALPVARVQTPGAHLNTLLATINWEPRVAAQSYRFKTCADAACSVGCGPEIELQSTQYNYTGLEAQSVYACVQTVDERGKSSTWMASEAPMNFDTIAPVVSLPSTAVIQRQTQLTASVAGADQILWTLLEGPAGSQLGDAQAASTSFQVTQDGVYRLKLQARDKALNSTDAQILVTADHTPPVFAGVAEAWRSSTTEVTLAWAAAQDALTPTIQYQLCLSTVLGSCLSNFVVTRELGTNTRSAVIPSLPEGPTYEFVIRATDGAGNRTVGAQSKQESSLKDAVQLASGKSHSCAIVGTDKAVYCWGQNDSGQLGNGTFVNSAFPVRAGTLTAVENIELGDSHSCARLANGDVRCWGSNSYGQLGDGTLVNRNSPQAVSDITTATSVTTGELFSCARLADATAVCWGRNAHRQIGDTTTTDRLTPVPVLGVSGISQIKAAGQRACALLTSDGSIRCWGRNNQGQLGDNSTLDRGNPVTVSGITGASQISLGYEHSCALIGQAVRCWGYNNNGQVGDNSTTRRLTSVAVAGTSLYTAVAAGNNHTCGILTDGTAECWGSADSGKLGDGTEVNKLVPTAVLGLTQVAGLAPGNSHTCAILASNQGIRCWGSNGSGQLGLGSNVTQFSPRAPFGLSAVRQLMQSDYFSCAILADNGQVQCWGSNDYGQLGDGTKINRATPVSVAGVTGASSIAVGYHHACAVIEATGELKCWGRSLHGALGQGNTSESLVPVTVSLPPVRMVAADDWSTCAVLQSDDTVRCWGGNGNGELADGTTTQRTSPVATIGLGPVHTVVGGTFHFCAILKDDSLKCWGHNSFGELGDGTRTHSGASGPVAVSGIGSVKDVALGVFHTCAVTQSGSVACWGANWAGQVGDGTSTSLGLAAEVASGYDKLVPFIIPGVTGAHNVSTGAAFSCASYGTDKKVKCWGMNRSGELGAGHATDPTPGFDPVQNLSGAQSITSGRVQTCAMLVGGQQLCWGGNENGQLGIEGRVLKTAAPGLSVSRP